MSRKISLMLIIMKLVTEVAVDWPEGVRSPLLAVVPVGKRSRRTVVGMVGEGLKQTCHWERSPFFFKTDLALQAATAIFLSSFDLAFAFFAAFHSAWGWVLVTPQTPTGAKQELDNSQR